MINRIIIVCMLAFACCVDSISACLDNQISRIAIKKMGWDVLTSKNIDCWEFDELKIPSTMVCDSFMVHKILSCLSKLDPIDKTYIDVRCKLFLYSSDSIVSSICIGREAVFKKGTYFKLSPELRAVIDSLKYTDNLIIKRHGISVEDDNNRLARYLESQKTKLFNFNTDSVAFFISCRIGQNGNCLEVKIGKNYYNSKDNPFKNKELLQSIIKEFRWSSREDRQDNEWRFIHVKIVNNDYEKTNLDRPAQQ